MPPVVNPVSDLARVYRQRVPTQTSQPAARSDRFGFGMATRPTGQTSSSALGAIGRFAKNVAQVPLDMAMSGGRSLETVFGDAKELGRSIVTGEDTLSQSPTARAYQAAGGGFGGALRAALPYVDVATAAIPTTKLLTPAGRVALAANPAEELAKRQILAAETRDAERRAASSIAIPYKDGVVDREAFYNSLYGRGYNVEHFPEEAADLTHYTGSGYVNINNLLRGGELAHKSYLDVENYANMIRAMDRIIASSPKTAAPMTVYRGVKMPALSGPFHDDLRNLLIDPVPGTIMRPDPAFMSTTIDPSVAKFFGNPDQRKSQFMFKINIPAGSQAIYRDPFDYSKLVTNADPDWAFRKIEDEVILPRNTQLRFVGQEGNQLVFDAIPGRVFAPPYTPTPGRAQRAFDRLMGGLMRPQQQFNLKEALLEGGPSVA